MLFHGFYILNKKPLTVACWGDDAWETITSGSTKPELFIWHCAWNQGTFARMAKMKYKFFKLKQKGIKPILVVNSKEEERLRRFFGITGFKSSSYVFVDEKDYAIQQTEKIYKAVYAAQISGFKRIPLARKIDPLFVMTYKRGETQWDLHQEYPTMSTAHYNNTWLDPKEKNGVLSKSSVGLCLSEEEGPMLASLEYMLNGLPVVSTPSKGGRDEYYDDRYCKIVEPSALLVGQGVDELISNNIDPKFVRQETIKRLQADRKRYAENITNYIKAKHSISLNTEEMQKKWFDEPRSNFFPLSEYDKMVSSQS